MTERYEKQLKKGVLEILVLKLLAEEEKYGYQLIQEMREKSREMFVLREGTLYPILYRMEEEGLIESRWSQPKDREVARKYYGITQPGKENLAELIALWNNFSRQVSEMIGG